MTEALLVRRAEHNERNLTTLEEIGLHGQGIERIELINQLCRHLRILYLQSNVICKIEQLHRLKVRRRRVARPCQPTVTAAHTPAQTPDETPLLLLHRSWRF